MSVQLSVFGVWLSIEAAPAARARAKSTDWEPRCSQRWGKASLSNSGVVQAHQRLASRIICIKLMDDFGRLILNR
jgi:hypothetical protein